MELNDPNWGFKFELPEGWRYQQLPASVILGHDTIAGVIFVRWHEIINLKGLKAKMTQGFQEEQADLQLAGPLEKLGQNIYAGTYAGISAGQQMMARGLGTLSPYGGAVITVAMTIPMNFGPQLSDPADSIARTMTFTKVDVNDLIHHFAGTWKNYTQSTETTMVLYPDGTYEDSYNFGTSGQHTDQYGNQTGTWGVARDDHSAGRWTARGDKRQGALLLTDQNGNQILYRYQVHVERGQTFWNAYNFEGKHFSKE